MPCMVVIGSYNKLPPMLLCFRAKSKFGCEMPCMVVIRRNDSVQPFQVYSYKFQTENMASFLVNAQLPAMVTYSLIS